MYLASFENTQNSIKQCLRLGTSKKKIDESAVRNLFEKLSSFYVAYVHSLVRIIVEPY